MVKRRSTMGETKTNQALKKTGFPHFVLEKKVDCSFSFNLDPRKRMMCSIIILLLVWVQLVTACLLMDWMQLIGTHSPETLRFCFTVWLLFMDFINLFEHTVFCSRFV